MSKPSRSGPETPPELIEIYFTVDPGRHGWRLDQFVKARIPRLSRSRIQQMIRGQEALGGTPRRPASRVQAGQIITLLRPAPEEPDVPRTFEVLHTDDQIMAIAKPAGLPVHATARFHNNTLTALLRERFHGQTVPQMAHRLDRETSGLMLLGRTSQAGAALKASFRRREVHKRYLALVQGAPPPEGEIDMPLGPDVASGIRVKMCVTADGLPAQTRFVTLETRGEVSLVEAWPRTGRQHQLRAHLGALGHPVIGDKLYGPDPGLFLEYLETGWTEALAARLPLPRHALHAHTATFPHPGTGEEMTLTCPLAEDLQNFWKNC